MPVIVNNIRLSHTVHSDDAIKFAINKCSLSPEDVKEKYIVKASLDARKRTDISVVYSVGLVLEASAKEEKVVVNANSNDVVLRKKMSFETKIGTKKLAARPIVAGFGPAGMFAGLLLAQNGYKPIVIERGQNMEERVKGVEHFWKTGEMLANVQFGEGGAGTFSDGKLTTRINDSLVGFILEELCKNGASKDILYKAKPHIGTDLLRQIVVNIRENIKTLGGEIHFNEKLEKLKISDGVLTGIKTSKSDYDTNTLILAIGHSARDTLEMLLSQKIVIQPKAFSVGARIEHLQSDIDESLYGDVKGLPAGEYQLSYREGSRGVYTFCMCPGGFVVPAASEEGVVVTNGMSYHARDGENANAGLVVSVDTNDFGSNPLDGVEFQRKLEKLAFRENFQAPAQTVGNFLAGKGGITHGRVTPSYANGVYEANLESILPQHITDMMKKGLRTFAGKLRAFSYDDAVLTGVETRTSSPVRITRTENMQTIGICGIYPCGEGAGYAGGIVSAAVDGVKIARHIMEQFAPM